MGKVVLADSIAALPHLAAWDSLFSERFANFPLEKLLVYLVDTIDASALPALAYQFDVLGYEGWNLCDTEDQQRAIIKNAIALKKKKGTVWAVKRALELVGYGDAVITEGVDGSWARFSVKVSANGKAISADKTAEVVKMINLYKPHRSILTPINYILNLSDDISVIERFSANKDEFVVDEIAAGASRLCDGTYYANGSIDASLDADILIITKL